ncbi:hypothetical protein OGM63_21400 [Plectonema radiosum NIES-515]|uniref:TMhelix containing protein n=1 Tax=Plectonema radiosum NIES-515 TaxID=2986073 RepID=A0ABT3B3V8_9CYAN|nr:hypothetical protein [Plectonema radiosum]MCV3216034.1 hypothetical protein [Plectonema radiosum NIES-515]
MKELNIQTLIALGAFLLALLTNVFGVVVWYAVWYANSEKKKYAAERDFNHLKNNQIEISGGIAEIAKDLDGRFDDLDKRLNSQDHDLLEIKTYLNIHVKQE